MNKKEHKANIILVGAGRGGTALLEIFHDDPTINIIGIVDINPDARGIGLAQKLGVNISKYADTFLKNQNTPVDIIIDVTGSDKIRKELQSIKSPHTRMISGIAAKFLWTLIDIQKDRRLLLEKYNNLKASIQDNPNEELIFGINPQMLQLRKMIQQVASTPATVLILGETGTGKEMIASTIQQQSHLRDQPFVKINCTAFAPHLLESELFGYKKGAFTGATKDKLGLLEKGDGGTIFLDEIGDISLEMQVKMLRFLQFGEIRPVGATETKIIQCRIIAATNRDLEKLIEEEKFRKDLFYRLNSFILELPPLRKRKEDIPVLSYHFLQLAVLKMNKRVQSISSKAIECLNEYSYPGNLRELHSIIERAVILCQGETIEPSHLPLTVQSSNEIYTSSDSFMQAREKKINQFERQEL
ncbi:MAG TPA: AAA family ATPase, partial [Phaeodactylibacter sp.]|nr:AAA family ATPase [Phaeodactylibacter sp.]